METAVLLERPQFLLLGQWDPSELASLKGWTSGSCFTLQGKVRHTCTSPHIGP